MAAILTNIDYLLAALLIPLLAAWLVHILPITEECPPDCDECNREKDAASREENY